MIRRIPFSIQKYDVTLLNYNNHLICLSISISFFTHALDHVIVGYWEKTLILTLIIVDKMDNKCYCSSVTRKKNAKNRML